MKNKIAYEDARYRAGALIETLKPFCQRIEIAGSIRRRQAEVGDIELVAIPLFITDMFKEPTGEHTLNLFDWTAVGIPLKNGPKYKQIELYSGINLDLFIVTPPAEWGVQFVIRTGPADFSHKLVTPRKHGGMLPSNLKVKDGAIWSNNHILPTPEEQDVFDLIGVPFIEPEDRR